MEADVHFSKVGGDSEKSTTQSTADKVTGKSDEAKGDTVTDKIKGAVGLDK